MRDAKHRILLVDDEPSIVMIVGKRLEHEGFEVIVATDGEAALTKIREVRPDLIILDVVLPQLTGYEVCAQLKQDPRYQQIPIIMLTAMDAQQDDRYGRECGADAYLAKPVHTPALLEQMRTLLTRAPAAPRRS